MNSLDLDRAVETFAQAVDGTVGLEEEFSLLHPATLELEPRFEELLRSRPHARSAAARAHHR